MKFRFKFFFCSIFFSLFFSSIQAQSKEVDSEFEEYKKMKKREEIVKKQNKEEEEYREYLEFQEYKRKKEQEEQKENELKEKKITMKDFAVNFLTGSSALSDNLKPIGIGSQYLALGEFHKGKSPVGFRFGLNMWNYSYKIRDSEFDKIYPIFILAPAVFPLYYTLNFEQYERKNLSGIRFDFLVDYHFRPKEFLAPYVFGGFGAGRCSKSCNNFQLLFGAGYKINFEFGYIMTEFFAEKPYIIFSDNLEYGAVNSLVSTGIRIGFGIILK